MQNFTTPETWKPVVGYEGHYEVSDHGRVRSLDREVYVPAWGRARFHRGRVLANGMVGKYPQAHLYDESGQRALLVHSLVAASFIGPRPDGMQVCHEDGNPLNNAASNLRYDTVSGNSLDKNSHGTMVRGSDVKSSRLTAAQVREIRGRARRGEQQKRLAHEFGVSRSAVNKICMGKAWGWLT